MEKRDRVCHFIKKFIMFAFFAAAIFGLILAEYIMYLQEADIAVEIVTGIFGILGVYALDILFIQRLLEKILPYSSEYKKRLRKANTINEKEYADPNIASGKICKNCASYHPFPIPGIYDGECARFGFDEQTDIYRKFKVKETSTCDKFCRVTNPHNSNFTA